MDTNFTPSKNHADVQYLNLLQHIMDNGTFKSDRTGTGTKSVFGYQMRFDLNEGFPLLTTKKLYTKGIIYELLWFLKGDTNIKYLNDNGVHIWDEWADQNGDLGPIYGGQWRKWPMYVYEKAYDIPGYAAGYEWQPPFHIPATYVERPIDQISNLIEMIKKNPDSRRLIVSAWNVAEIDKMALPPCHCLFQFYVADGKLSCQLYQRSCDMFLGVPFNIASYALLTMMIAQVTGLEYGEFVWTSGDTHIYSNHYEQVALQLSRRGDIRPMPKMWINPEVKDIFGFKYEDFKLTDYNPHPSIKAPIAV